MCGENNQKKLLQLLVPGSPPRVRGKLHAVPCAIFRERITPACAGKTRQPTCAGSYVKDHPRVCGENEAARFKSFFEKGSPPRVRGKHSDHGGCRFQRGITPACAGKTVPVCRDVVMQQDHPRVCGENLHRSGHGCPRGGSPPRVRGKRYLAEARPQKGGITPACAGKTPHQPLLPSSCRDHPRVCGENYGMNGAYWCAEGSPPRVRGKPTS